eukprot:SAG31_NODE_19030_length_614_cov_0.693204_1_plen_39_part_10
MRFDARASASDRDAQRCSAERAYACLATTVQGNANAWVW